jgi:dihydrofolate reductase
LRRLVYYVGATLDGFIAAPDGSYDFFPFQGAHLDHLTRVLPETVPTAHREVLDGDPPAARFDTVLMGRGSYDPARTAGVLSPYDHLRQVVFSRTLDPAAHPGVEIVSGDPVTLVRELKGQPGGDLWLCGGGNLAGQLLTEIDEVILKLYPIVAGSGIPLVSRTFAPHRLTLTDTRSFANGTVLLHYRAG